MGPCGRAMSRCGIALTVLLAYSFALPAGAPAAVAPPRAVAKPTAGEGLRRRVAPPKPAHTDVQAGESSTFLRVKFREGSSIRLRGSHFVSSTGEDLAGLSAALGTVPGTALARLAAEPEDAVAADKARVEDMSGRQQADFNLYYRVTLPDGADAEALLDRLNALDVVEIAYPEPLLTPPPSPNFTGFQGYRGSEPNGIGVDDVASVSGANGSRVKVIDIESNWNIDHEDLAKATGAFIPNGTFQDPFTDCTTVGCGTPNHGTNVIGVLSGDADAQGVTGIVPNAALGLVNRANTERGDSDWVNAIKTARRNLSAGDVLLIEGQVAGPNGGCGSDAKGCVAVEFVPDAYDEIVMATSSGIIVVEAAGNGNEELTFDFPRNRPDSGAILVGAGGAPNCSQYTGPERARLSFSSVSASNFGDRVDLQGWGECVVTTGGGPGTVPGNLQGGTNQDLWYDSRFAGTSSASPIVAGAAASLSSAVEAATGIHLTSWQARARLQRTGTAQNMSSGTLPGRIGPLPDLDAAMTRPITVAANDAFASATAITSTTGATRTTTGTNLWSSSQTGEPRHVGIRGGASVWFRWTAPATGAASVDTISSNFDTLLAVYSGSGLTNLTPIAGNDDIGGGIRQSSVALSVTEGATYYIAVDGFNGDMGAITLHTSLPGAPVPNAGADQSPAHNTAFFLDANASTDPQGDPLSFAWLQVSGPSMLIESPNAARTRVVDSQGSGTKATFRVVVTDSHGNSDSDLVNISTK